VIKTLEAQVGQFLVDYKWPVSRSIVVQEQDPLGDLSAAAVFPSKCTGDKPVICDILPTTNLTWTGLGLKPDHLIEKPETNGLNHDTAFRSDPHQNNIQLFSS
jgi:hypothetical protein